MRQRGVGSEPREGPRVKDGPSGFRRRSQKVRAAPSWAAPRVLAVGVTLTLFAPTSASVHAASDRCVEVPADLLHERENAPVFLDIADEEREAGRLPSAKVAYREALRRDPQLSLARERLRALCVALPDPGPSPWAAGTGDCEGALAKVDASPEHPKDAAESLLEGICRYEVGQDARADALLEAAAKEGELKDVAQFYRGLVARRRGRAAEARAWFKSAEASGDPRLRRAAQELAVATDRESGLALLLLLESGYDSNVALLPNGTPEPIGVGDPFLGGAALFSAYPWGRDLPGVQVLTFLRKQSRETRFDLAQLGLSLGWHPTLGGWQPRVKAQSQLVVLDQAPHLWSVSVGVGLRRALGKGAVEAVYNVGTDDFRTAEFTPYSGTRQAGVLSGQLPLGETMDLELGYGSARLAAREDALSYVEHGPFVGTRLSFSKGVSVAAEVGTSWRSYALGERDVYLDGSLQVEWAFNPRWSLTASWSGRDARSELVTGDYQRWVTSMGVSHAAPLP